MCYNQPFYVTKTHKERERSGATWAERVTVALLSQPEYCVSIARVRAIYNRIVERRRRRRLRMEEVTLKAAVAIISGDKQIRSRAG